MTSDKGRESSFFEEVDTDTIPFEGVDLLEEDEDYVKNEVKGSIEYAFIGVGQCGSRIAEQFYKLGYKKTIVINTAAQDLEGIEVPDSQKLLVRSDSMDGAGKDMMRGEEAVQSNQQQVFDLMKRIFGANVDHIIICLGAGGGTGGGGTIPLTFISKKYLKYAGHENVGRRVGAIMTVPSQSESASSRVADNAYQLCDKLSSMSEEPTPSLSPLMVFDNERIRKLYKNLTVNKFWPTINYGVASLFDTFNRLSAKPSKQWSFDPSDYASIINAGGHCIMGVCNLKNTEGKDISQAIWSNLQRTLLADGFDMSTAKAAASIVVGSNKIFSEVPGLMDSIDYGFGTLATMVGTTVHRGIYEDDKDLLRVYTIIGGLERPRARYRQLKSMGGEVYPS